jgi:hypothetical protein
MTNMTQDRSIQETYSPDGICFGCGPLNEKGLRIRSFVEGDEFVAVWSAEPHHQAFPGVLNGGIIGALLDCHSNWAACVSPYEKARRQFGSVYRDSRFSCKTPPPDTCRRPDHIEGTRG